MKKEIEITFEKQEIENKELLAIDIIINGRELDDVTITSNAVKYEMSHASTVIFGIKEHTLEQYLSIPEIKKLHDEHFKKEVDLFEFTNSDKRAYYITPVGVVEHANFYNCVYINKLKENYNIFPSEELCEKARPMSLDERKQLLFAEAKGYEVFTREEAVECTDEVYSLCYNGICYMHEFQFEMHDYTSNVYFKEKEQAQECADFMNEKNK